MPKPAEQKRVRKIEREYEKKGYSKAHAEYIGRASVYGKKTKKHSAAKRRKK